MEVEDPDTGSVSLDKFLPYMVNVITEYQWVEFLIFTSVEFSCS